MNDLIDWRRESAPGSLASMRVLDLSQQLPGPYCSELLATLGADVVKVEPPQGDAARHLDPTMFEAVNRGKRSVRLNLKDDADREHLMVLMREADVLIEGFRPGVTERLGCDYESVRSIQPRIVYCSISGFGQQGPLARRPTHDVSLQAVAGALSPDETLKRIGVPWVDLGTGTTAAFLIVSAWHGGEGGYIDAAMLDTALSWAQVKPEAVLETEPSYGTCHSADGQLVVIALLEDEMWARMCAAFEWTDWQQDVSLAQYRDRRKRAVEVRSRLEQTIASIPAARITELAHEFDLPVEVVDGQDDETVEQVSLRSTGIGGSALPVPESWRFHEGVQRS